MQAQEITPPRRDSHGGPEAPRILTPVKAIRAKCLDCCCDSAKEVGLCHIFDCSLWPYRLGKNPNRVGIGGKGRPFEKSRRSTEDFSSNLPL